MLLPDIRRLALADLTPDVLRRLVEHGESLLVERKRDLPNPPKFGAAAASFANMLGGWILLGVTDGGEVVGWEPGERLDVQSHLGALLRGQVDPLPPFVAALHELDGKQVGVVRIFESVDSPHVVRGSGAIYVRSSKGKEPVPVDDHQTVLGLARRGEDAEREARKRLTSQPAVARVLKLRDMGYPMELKPKNFRVVARAAPLTVTPALHEWPATRRAAEAISARADELVRPWSLMQREGPARRTFGRAVTARVVQMDPNGRENVGMIVADSGGVIGVELTHGVYRHDGKPFAKLDSLVDEQLRPIAGAMAALLGDAEAYGRVATDVQIVVPSAGSFGEQQRKVYGVLHVPSELVSPADADEVERMVGVWYRELQRSIGIEAYEDD